MLVTTDALGQPTIPSGVQADLSIIHGRSLHSRLTHDCAKGRLHDAQSHISPDTRPLGFAYSNRRIFLEGNLIFDIWHAFLWSANAIRQSSCLDSKASRAATATIQYTIRSTSTLRSSASDCGSSRDGNDSLLKLLLPSGLLASSFSGEIITMVTT